MKKKEKSITRLLVIIIGCALCLVLIIRFNESFLTFATRLAVFGAERFLPTGAVTVFSPQTENDISVAATTLKESETTITQKQTEQTKKIENEKEPFSLTKIPDDIAQLITKAKETAKKDRKDGAIYEKQYKNEGVTDSFGTVKVKNTNQTDINIENLLEKKADLIVESEEPTVLIFHTHTTETYQMLDRDFYAEGFLSRSKDENVNMVRVGDEIVRILEKENITVIHDTLIHDSKYNGAYDNSRKTVVEYLKKYPSIQVVLDIHRDAIQETDGTKIKPTAKIDSKKAAQIMIISGCQEEGNTVEDFPDWKYNLIFALQLQKKTEEMFPGIMRPLFFCPRRYNMNLTHCSLLIEIGSDANTLDEAAYSARLFATALGKLLNEYKEE